MNKQEILMSPHISQFKHLSCLNCSVRFLNSTLPSIWAKQKVGKSGRGFCGSKVTGNCFPKTVEAVRRP